MRIWLPFHLGGVWLFYYLIKTDKKKNQTNPLMSAQLWKGRKYQISKVGILILRMGESHHDAMNLIWSNKKEYLIAIQDTNKKNAMKQVSLGKYQFLYYRFKLALCFISTSLVPKSLILKSSLSNTLALHLARTQLDWLMSVSTHYSIPGQLIAISP